MVSGGREAALAWLMQRINYERTAAIPYNTRQLKLERMRTLLARLGHPAADVPIIHVAGTKGKGSTSAMIAAMLTAAGYRTGVFSSPHLERIEERFSVNGAAATGDEFAALIDRVRPAVEAIDAAARAAGDDDGEPTYFEITTAVALLHFAEQSCDVAVLEVGLGGRLDSTNVCLPVVAVITSIGFDHMQQLGYTLAAIAGEKAGIIKRGVPVVCGVIDAEPQAVIARVADEHNCRLIQAGRDFRYHYTPGAREAQQPATAIFETGAIDFEYLVAGQEFQLTHARLAMRGAHQAANAATALATIAELRRQGWQVPAAAQRAGLATALLRGRIEFFPGPPAVVVDTTHNPASAAALVATLDEIPCRGPRTLVLAVSRDKDVPAIVQTLAPHFDRIVATAYQENRRAAPVGELAELVRAAWGENHRGTVELAATPREAWEAACRTAKPAELICIAGSFFLAAEVRPLVVAQQHVAPHN